MVTHYNGHDIKTDNGIHEVDDQWFDSMLEAMNYVDSL